MSFKYDHPLPEPTRQSRLSSVAPAILVRYVEGLRACRKVGLDIVPFETFRSTSRQQWLWQQGREWSGSIVTAAATVETSWHGAGGALDSAFVRDGGIIYWPTDNSIWLQFGQIMEEHGLRWGGRWKRPDSPHVQAINTPVTPTLEDQKLILAGKFQEIWHKYDLDIVSYFDNTARL